MTQTSSDERLKNAISSIPDVRVLVIKSFRQGEPLILTKNGEAGNEASELERAPDAAIPVAKSDLCLVKLLVGPGNPGPEDAPSTSAGIGIEILLPDPGHWNERIRAFGNSGWAGSLQSSLSTIASNDLHVAAAGKGFVVATSDHGHTGSPANGSFAMNPDGSINTTGWHDFSERSLHELAVKTKLITRLFYGREARYAYWDGFSTGGRQGLKFAQAFPEDFDGILAGAPAINWTRYHTAGLYAHIAMQQDLGRRISPEKLAAVTQACIAASGGGELGFILDPLSSRYDPEKDPAILCTNPEEPGAGNAEESETRLTLAEAKVINKAWYGQTIDGSVPDPELDNGNNSLLSDDKRLWFGWMRGTDLNSSPVGDGNGLILAADQTALEMNEPALGSKLFVNATGKGEERWRDTMDYATLTLAQNRGLQLQPEFSEINTDNPDLSAFASAGGKLLMYHGFSDEYIPVQGSINYFERVSACMGGAQQLSAFFRLYLIPGFTHNGRLEGQPFVPLPQSVTGRDEMFSALQNWVEGKIVPECLTVTSADAGTSLPLCPYPSKIAYQGTGPVKSASSYSCR